MTDRWPSISRWFEQVCDLPFEAGVRRLDEECDDPAVRREVRELLRAADRVDETLRPSPAYRGALGGGFADGERADARIGPYRLVRLLGRGGMGSVWLARRDDDAYRHDVALKIVKRGLDTDEVVRRFRRERQLLADLAHPHIARLHDGGATEDGRPYLVMEAVEGVPLDVHCRDRDVPLEGRIALVAAVAEAVQVAHERGIVHRDLKPANVLVTPDGAPKLLDFGIAKLLADDGPEASLLTRTGQRMLTPRYASPEQVRGEQVTTATDVWALGVILYELATGRAPFEVEGASSRELEDAICRDEPPRPSAVTTVAGRRALVGDLDVVLARALAKDARRRYADAGALADDLRRHLDGRPILARPDTVTYRVGKFVRRNRLLVGATLAVVAALAAGLIAAMLQFREAERGRRAAEAQRRVTEEVNRFLTEDLLRGADPARSRDADVRMRDVLDAASTRIEGRFQDAPLVEAAVRHALAGTYVELGLYAEAEPHARRAFELRTAELGPKHVDTFMSGRELASALFWAQRLDESIALNEALWESRRRTAGRTDAYALVVGGNLALGYDAAGRLDDAERLHREILSVRREVWGDEHENTLSTMNNLAVLLLRQGRFEEAHPLLERAVELRSKLLGNDHPKTLVARGNLAGALFKLGRYGEATARFEEILEFQERVDGPNHPRTLQTLGNLGVCRLQVGDAEGAERWLRRAVEGWAARDEPDHPSAVHFRGMLDHVRGAPTSGGGSD